MSVFTEQLNAAYDLEHPHVNAATRVTEADVLAYIDSFTAENPPTHPTSAIAWDLWRTFGARVGRRLFLRAARHWDKDPVSARTVIDTFAFGWPADYEPQAWVDVYLSEALGDWDDEIGRRKTAEAERSVETEKQNRIAKCKERVSYLERACAEGWRPYGDKKWPDPEVVLWNALYSSLSYRQPDDLETAIDYFEKKQRSLPVAVVPFPMQPSAQPVTPPAKVVQTSEEFLAGFEPPEFLIDNTVLRRYCYSMTARTGVGKTSIAMRWMAHVVTARPIGDKEVQQGHVLYFAGENPSDILYRWMVLSRDMGIDPKTDMVHWIVGAKNLNTIAEQVTAEVAAKNLNLALVVIDTAAAYNPGDEENSNNQAGDYARQLRSLTALPGGPCVVILCHPTKSASDDDLVPRGGGAFLAEVDGNLAVMRKESILAVTPLGKYRGDMSWVQRYEIAVIDDHPKLKDARGRQMKSVLARPVAEATAAVMERRADGDALVVLNALCNVPASTPTDLARALGWVYGTRQEPNVNRVKRYLDRLLKDKAVKETLGRWKATATGQQALNDADRASEQQPKPVFPLPHGMQPPTPQ